MLEVYRHQEAFHGRISVSVLTIQLEFVVFHEIQPEEKKTLIVRNYFAYRRKWDTLLFIYKWRVWKETRKTCRCDDET